MQGLPRSMMFCREGWIWFLSAGLQSGFQLQMDPESRTMLRGFQSLIEKDWVTSRATQVCLTDVASSTPKIHKIIGVDSKYRLNEWGNNIVSCWQWSMSMPPLAYMIDNGIMDHNALVTLTCRYPNINVIILIWTVCRTCQSNKPNRCVFTSAL